MGTICTIQEKPTKQQAINHLKKSIRYKRKASLTIRVKTDQLERMEKWNQESNCWIKSRRAESRTVKFEESCFEKVPRRVWGKRQWWEVVLREITKAKESQDCYLRFFTMIKFFYLFQTILDSISLKRKIYHCTKVWDKKIIKFLTNKSNFQILN